MTSKFIHAVNNNLLKIDPSNRWIKDNIHYEVIMGSQAYSVSQDSSDMDIYGWCIPPKTIIFPHLAGYIKDFGEAPPKFGMFEQHHVGDKGSGKQYDFAIYNIVKYFDLVLENNPNMIDSLFVPEHCILHMTASGRVLRDLRRTFLHKGAYHKFTGYAHSQIHKMKIKQPDQNTSSKRYNDIQEKGYDSKFAYHCVRLLNECEQILTVGDIDLQRNNELLKTIRRGEWTLEQIFAWFEAKIVSLESQYQQCKLPHSPNWKSASNTLLGILEDHYGNIQQAVSVDRGSQILDDLQNIISKYRD